MPKVDKNWAAALNRAVNRESAGKGSPKWLEVIAETVVKAAAEGDMQAVREIGDRLDGKPKQTIGGDGEGGSIPVSLNVGFRATD